MNKISLDNELVNISICGWDKIWSLKSQISFSKSNILKVYPYDGKISPPWLRNPGTAIPKVIIAGTYHNLKGRTEFWCTHFNGNTIVIDLAEEKYNRVVLDLPSDQSVHEWMIKLST